MHAISVVYYRRKSSTKKNIKLRCTCYDEYTSEELLQMDEADKMNDRKKKAEQRKFLRKAMNEHLDAEDDEEMDCPDGSETRYTAEDIKAMVKEAPLRGNLKRLSKHKCLREPQRGFFRLGGQFYTLATNQFDTSERDMNICFKGHNPGTGKSQFINAIAGMCSGNRDMGKCLITEVSNTTQGASDYRMHKLIRFCRIQDMSYKYGASEFLTF